MSWSKLNSQVDNGCKSRFTNDVARHDSKKNLKLDIAAKSHLTLFRTLMLSNRGCDGS